MRELLRTLRASFPRGEVLCDVMTLDFFNAFSQPIHRQIVELGASFELPDHPIADIFASEHYTEGARISTTKRAAELGQMPWYMRPMVYLSRTFVEGYSIRVFTPA